MIYIYIYISGLILKYIRRLEEEYIKSSKYQVWMQLQHY